MNYKRYFKIIALKLAIQKCQNFSNGLAKELFCNKKGVPRSLVPLGSTDRIISYPWQKHRKAKTLLCTRLQRLKIFAIQG